MSKIIAVAGKGGTGKTTVVTLIIKYLIENNKIPSLAVDADPNSNLPTSLGVNYVKSIGEVLDEFQENLANIPPGVTKESYIEGKVSEIISEEKGFDLLVMGKGEGPGCYCYVNSLLRKFTDTVYKNYKYVVMDNEAGMEHLSRKTTRNIDILLLVSDCSLKGINSVVTISKLADDLKLGVKKKLVVVNRVHNKLAENLIVKLQDKNLELAGEIKEDANIYQFDLEEKSLLLLPATSVAVISILKFIYKIV